MDLGKSRRRNCARKVHHETREAAIAAMRSHVGAARLTVYRCSCGQGWCLGHWPKGRTRR